MSKATVKIQFIYHAILSVFYKFLNFFGQFLKIEQKLGPDEESMNFYLFFK
jgi:hypothetical protein